jgi:hypothetical protein
MILLKILQQHATDAPAFDTPTSRAVFPGLVRHASVALRAGVCMTLTEYQGLSLLERVAFAKAGDELEGRKAQRVGLASSSLLGAALATQEEDDGEVAEEIAVGVAHAQALAEANRG